MILWGVLDPTYEWTRSIGVFIVGYFLLGTALAASAVWLFRSFSTEPERLKRMGREIVMLVVVFIFVPPVIIWVWNTSRIYGRLSFACSSQNALSL